MLSYFDAYLQEVEFYAIFGTDRKAELVGWRSAWIRAPGLLSCPLLMSREQRAWIISSPTVIAWSDPKAAPLLC
jgi:hypothetical protein